MADPFDEKSDLPNTSNQFKSDAPPVHVKVTTPGFMAKTKKVQKVHNNYQMYGDHKTMIDYDKLQASMDEFLEKMDSEGRKMITGFVEAVLSALNPLGRKTEKI